MAVGIRDKIVKRLLENYFKVVKLLQFSNLTNFNNSLWREK